MEPERSIVVADAEAGERLDRLVARALGLSRGWVRRLLDAERVLLAGRPAAKGAILRAGDRIDILPFPRPESGPLPNPELPLELLHRDADLVAISKPAGQPVHPLAPEETDTALNALVARFPELVGVGEGGLRSGVVHRLDPGTSGALVFALSDEAWQRAREAFAQQRVHKRYVARVHGCFRGEREVLLFLSSRGDHVRVVERGGRRAVSRVRALESFADSSLVEIEMRTGVRHQIRVSLAWLGHPVVGDALYGSNAGLDRHLLHAAALAFDGFACEAPLPPELRPTGAAAAASTPE